MTGSETAETLKAIVAELEGALRGILSPSAMELVERLVRTSIALQEAELRHTHATEIEEAVSAAVAKAKSLPPPEIFVGVVSARDVLQNYLRWHGQPVYMARIVSDAYDRLWKPSIAEAQRALHAAAASHALGKKPRTDGIKQPILFRYDKDSGLLSLLEWQAGPQLVKDSD